MGESWAGRQAERSGELEFAAPFCLTPRPAFAHSVAMFSRQRLLTASLIASLLSALTGAQAAPRYTVDRDRILRDGQPVVLRGVDALEVFGLNEKDPKLMDEWKVQ